MAHRHPFEQSWAQLDPRFRACLNEAWTAVRSKGLPVGAVISDGSTIVSRGRNRVYDPAGGSDPLQRSPIAHAEMNAIASADEGMDLAACELWTTHRPCTMCAAAIELSDLRQVHVLAEDPSAESPVGFAEPQDNVWSVVANVFFLHNVAWVGGIGNPMITRSTRVEPEVTSLAVALLAEEALIAMMGADEAALVIAAFWDRFGAAATERATRLGQ